jgi:hypothetical protein
MRLRSNTLQRSHAPQIAALSILLLQPSTRASCSLDYIIYRARGISTHRPTCHMHACYQSASSSVCVELQLGKRAHGKGPLIGCSTWGLCGVYMGLQGMRCHIGTLKECLGLSAVHKHAPATCPPRRRRSAAWCSHKQQVSAPLHTAPPQTLQILRRKHLHGWHGA